MYTRKPELIVALVIAFFSVPVTPSTPAPEEVVDQFVRMDLEGVRLTPEGWRKADAFFVEHSDPFCPRVLIIIGRNYAISKPTVDAHTNEFVFGYEEVGRLDTSSLRFSPTITGIETRSGDSFTVVNVRQNLDRDESAKKDKPDILQWKIAGAQPKVMHLTAKAAIHYLTQVRAKTSDRASQSKANEAISRLVPYE